LWYTIYMTNKAFVVLAIFFLGLPFFVSADSYFEFDPAYYNTTSLNVADVETPSEAFIPQNDFLDGFDLWLDNDGTSGPATFTLSAGDDVLISKTVTIPWIAKVAGGQRFHVSFNQLAVSNDQTYSIKIVSNLPALRLFYANRINLLPQNAPHLSEFADGIAYLGSEKQDFSFKFALYEDTEYSQPVLDNIAAAPVTETQAKITFNANEPVDYKLMYGLKGTGYTNQTNYLNDYNFCADDVSTCALFIDVQPESQYDYVLSVRDRWGNTAQAAGSFVTLGGSGTSPTGPPGDTSPPVISNIRLFPDVGNRVDIAWTTSEAADSTYLISYSEYMISIDAGDDTTYELEHFMRTDPLNPDTQYIGTITSRDIANNAISVSFVFNTGGLISSTPTPTFTATPTITIAPTISPTISPTTSVLPTTSASPIPSPTSSPWPTISFEPTSTPIPTPTPSSQPSGHPTPTQSGAPAPSPTATGSGQPIPSGGNSVTSTPPSQSDSLPPLAVSPDAGNATTVIWSAPKSGEPSNGYRIDIIDNHGQKISSQKIPAGTHQANLGILNEGDSVIVYANDNNVFQKVAKATKIEPEFMRKSFLEILITSLPYILGGVILIIFGVVAYLKFFKKQKPPVAPAGPSTDSYSSAQSVRT